jgi:hypothetical protein
MKRENPSDITMEGFLYKQWWKTVLASLAGVGTLPGIKIGWGVSLVIA